MDRLKELLQEHAYEYHKKPLRLHSGGRTNHFFNIVNALCHAEVIDQIEEDLHDIVGTGSMLVGIEFGGALLTAAINQIWWCKSAYYRKDGTIIGDMEDGYILIDDVVTTGTSIIQAIAEIEEQLGCFPSLVISIIDREEGNFLEADFKYISLFKMSDFNLQSPKPEGD